MRLPPTTRPPAPPATATPRAADRRAPPAAALLAAVWVVAGGVPAATARGLESVDLPDLPARASAGASAQRGALAAADEAFQSSPLLKELKERSDANRAANRRKIENKYCARQAELGIGDCGGLKYVPGATKSGKQKTPGWLAKIVGADPEKLEAAQSEAEAKVADAVKALQDQ